MSLNPGRRRRGAELERALLDAAWEELDAHGYDDLTYDAIAARAQTSRAVLYRRWSKKADLVRAAVLHVIGDVHVEPPDTGSLRSDVIEALRQVNTSRAVMAVALLTRLGDYYRATGESLADLIDEVTGGQNPIMKVIAERAAARGELDLDAVSDRVLRTPVDLFRLEFVLTYAPVPDKVIEEIVDEVFLPLIHHASTGSSPDI